jgi:hypothetical protein
MFLILKPLGSCPGASSIGGRLSEQLPSPLFVLLFIFFVCKYNIGFFIKSMWLLNFVLYFILVLSYVVPALFVVELLAFLMLAEALVSSVL